MTGGLSVNPANFVGKDGNYWMIVSETSVPYSTSFASCSGTMSLTMHVVRFPPDGSAFTEIATLSRSKTVSSDCHDA